MNIRYTVTVLAVLVSIFFFVALQSQAAFAPISVPAGGTGSTTLSGILVGNGASAVNTLTIGSGLSLIGTTLSTTGGTNYWTSLGNAIYNNTGTAVGINLTNPTAPLEVQATTTGGTVFQVWNNVAADIFNIKNTGNVGIGSSSPNARLSITGAGNTTGQLVSWNSSTGVNRFIMLDNGNIALGGASSTPGFPLVAQDSGFPTFGSFAFMKPGAATVWPGASVGMGLGFFSGTTNVGAIYVDNGGSFRISAAPSGVSQGITFASNGVGVSKLFTTGTSANFAPLIVLDSTSGGEAGFTLPVADTIGIVTARTERLRIDPTGRIGIGTTSPFAELSVSTTSANYLGQTLLAVADSLNSQVFTILGNDNSGFGTTTPYAQLSLGGGNLVIGAATAGGTPGDLFLPKLGTSAGSFLAVDVTGKVIATTTPSGGSGVTSVTGTYPIISSGGTTPAISLAFGTTTSNTWAGTQTFTNAPIISSLTGILKGNGSSALTVAANGTDYTLVSAQSCTNQVITALTAIGGSTCSSVSNAMLANSTISGVALGGTLNALTATNSTLTFSGSYDGSAARTIGLNLGNANTWTAVQTFSATTTHATSTFAQIGIGTSSPTFKVDIDGGTGNIFRIIYNQATALMSVVNSTITALGTWDFSNATVVQHVYPAFSYATSTSWTGTTTVPLGVAYTLETWKGVKCFTDTGTLNVSFNDGTNRMTMFNASTTVGSVTLSTNNALSAGTKRYVDIGTPATSPTKISCTVDKIVNQ